VNNKKKLKYEEHKTIELINEVAKYNELGNEDNENNRKGNNVYQTRKIDAQNKDSTTAVKIDEANLVKKKAINVPEHAHDSNYYTLIKNKREKVEQLNALRGYKKIFFEETIPNPDLYNCTDHDLEFIDELNSKLPHTQQLRPEDFERMIETWESEIGQIVTIEKRRTGTCPLEKNKIDVERAKYLLREVKELSQFNKHQQAAFTVEEVHAVGSA
jgi:hypothetical protein